MYKSAAKFSQGRGTGAVLRQKMSMRVRNGPLNRRRKQAPDSLVRPIDAIAEARDNGEDTFHLAFNDAGETRLPPQTTQVRMPIDGEFIVERARCQVQLGWGNATPGMARILNPETGEHSFVKREMLEVVS